MKAYPIYFIFMAIAVILCGCEDSILSGTDQEKGRFTISASADYDLAVTKSEVKPMEVIYSDNAMLTVEEGVWSEDIFLTRSTVDDVSSWPDLPMISLYCENAEATGTPAWGDKPYNPVTCRLTDSYSSETGATNVSGYDVYYTSFFWNVWTGRSSMPAKANFYGYYPRPADAGTNALTYQKTSVINNNIARTVTNWDKLQYKFETTQTDDNLWMHDIMYSVPMETSDDIVGNKNITAQAAALMSFEHLFSLLEINIIRGENHVGNGFLTKLTLSGNQVYTEGRLNITAAKDQAITKTVTSSISRQIPDNARITAESTTYTTKMIIQPCNPSADGDMIITCKVDGMDYSCDIKLNAASFPNGFEAGKKYTLNLTVNQSDNSLVFRIFQGSVVTYNSNTYNGAVNDIYTDGVVNVEYDSGVNTFKVTDARVLKGGELQTPDESGNYTIDFSSGNKAVYDIVYQPSAGNWYHTDDIRIHFDGIRNTMKSTHDNTTTVWYDQSGNGNNGYLASFNGTSTSGWDSSNSLIFDGVDDIVTFPGSINPTVYTMEFLIIIYTSQPNNASWPRLTGEGPDNLSYPAYFISPSGSTSAGSFHLYGHGGTYSLGSSFNNENKIVQLDAVYQNKTVYIYKNGTFLNSKTVTADAQSIATTSLSNRTADNSRALKAKYYSFILYDKALSAEEISDNYQVNKTRYSIE